MGDVADSEHDRLASEPRVTLVVAMARNRVIGRAGDMPWRMPSSLRRFRELTLGRPMIMGRKTFAAIGRVLDGRDTIIVTRDRALHVEGARVTFGIEEALAVARGLARGRQVDEIAIAGGGEIYLAALPYATCVHVDLIDADVAGDTYFPVLDDRAWLDTGGQPIRPHPNDQYAATTACFKRIGAAKLLPPA